MSWSALGSGISYEGGGGAVAALAMDAEGTTLYAGGYFTIAGDAPANYIAKWDGMSWSALDSGTSGAVKSLAVDTAGNLYAGGWFLYPFDNLAMWDGSHWSAVGGGFGYSANSLAVDNAGNLYVGAQDGHNVYGPARVLKWNGASWSLLGLLSSMLTDQDVTALLVDPAGNLYAGGFFWSVQSPGMEGVPASHIAKWDGSSWSALAGGVDQDVFALAMDRSGRLYAGGKFTDAEDIWCNYVASWDGAGWTSLGSGTTWDVTALAVDAEGGVYVGYGTGGASVSGRLVKWDGTGLVSVGGWGSGAVNALVLDGSGNLYAGGHFSRVGAVNAENVAKWDGTSWSALGAGVGGTEAPLVRALAVDAGGDLYAAGDFTTAGDVPANYIAKWDGTAWSALGNGIGGTDPPVVNALAIDAEGTLYAAGKFTSAGDIPANHIAMWNGAVWSALGTGMGGAPSPYVGALAVDAAGHLYAAGYFITAGGVTANDLAKWDGTAWSALSSKYIKLPRALAVDRHGDLYVGGSFITAVGGGVSARTSPDGTGRPGRRWDQGWSPKSRHWQWMSTEASTWVEVSKRPAKSRRITSPSGTTRSNSRSATGHSPREMPAPTAWASTSR
jgi:hypothetical protein